MLALIILISMLSARSIDVGADGRQYHVTKMDPRSAEMLGELGDRNIVFLRHLRNKYSNNPYVARLLRNYNPDTLYEHTPTWVHGDIAFTMFKGESIYICLRDGNRYESINDATFVLLHELAHLAIPQRGHPPEFWRAFKWLLREAVDVGIYVPVDYGQTPHRYCKFEINYNPLYDEEL